MIAQAPLPAGADPRSRQDRALARYARATRWAGALVIALGVAPTVGDVGTSFFNGDIRVMFSVGELAISLPLYGPGVALWALGAAAVRGSRRAFRVSRVLSVFLVIAVGAVLLFFLPFAGEYLRPMNLTDPQGHWSWWAVWTYAFSVTVSGLLVGSFAILTVTAAAGFIVRWPAGPEPTTGPLPTPRQTSALRAVAVSLAVLAGSYFSLYWIHRYWVDARVAADVERVVRDRLAGLGPDSEIRQCCGPFLTLEGSGFQSLGGAFELPGSLFLSRRAVFEKGTVPVTISIGSDDGPVGLFRVSLEMTDPALQHSVVRGGRRVEGTAEFTGPQLGKGPGDEVVKRGAEVKAEIPDSRDPRRAVVTRDDELYVLYVSRPSRVFAGGNLEDYVPVAGIGRLIIRASGHHPDYIARRTAPRAPR